jgi:hypothetical protein
MTGGKRSAGRGKSSVDPPKKKQRKPAPGGLRTVRGMSSATIFHQILQGDVDLDDDREALVELAIKSHRIKAVRKGAKGGRTVFNAQTGHHEWIPTDCMPQIISLNDAVWTQLFYTLRSPTWLLVLNPLRYSADAGDYTDAIKRATQRSKGADMPMVKASELGLVGHSGGLGFNGTQLTTHQSTWHNQLRDIFETHADDKSYDAYFRRLQAFIDQYFLFVSDMTLPGGGSAEVLKHIEWDLDLSYSRPTSYDKSGKTMADIAVFLNGHWATWLKTLENSFRAQVPLGKPKAPVVTASTSTATDDGPIPMDTSED